MGIAERLLAALENVVGLDARIAAAGSEDHRQRLLDQHAVALRWLEFLIQEAMADGLACLAGDHPLSRAEARPPHGPGELAAELRERLGEIVALEAVANSGEAFDAEFTAGLVQQRRGCEVALGAFICRELFGTARVTQRETGEVVWFGRPLNRVRRSIDRLQLSRATTARGLHHKNQARKDP